MPTNELMHTIADLQALDPLWTTAGYAGPLTLENATSYCAHLAEGTYGTGEPMFPDVRLVRQDAGYNIAYRNIPVQRWRPTGVTALDDIIEIYFTSKDVNERGNDHYRGNITSSAHRVGVKATLYGFFEQPQWAEYPYRQVWTHPALRAVLSFYEGTLVLVVCPDTVHYQAEVADAASTYGTPYRSRETT